MSLLQTRQICLPPVLPFLSFIDTLLRSYNFGTRFLAVAVADFLTAQESRRLRFLICIKINKNTCRLYIVLSIVSCRFHNSILSRTNFYSIAAGVDFK